MQRLLESSTSTVFDVTHLGRLSRAPEEPATKEFDVLLLDLGDAHPIAALGQARELFPGVPVVLVNDDADEARVAEVLARGASGHLLRSELSTQRLVTTLVAACGQLEAVAQLGGAGQPVPGLATHDRLTGLPNAWLFQDRLGQALAAARRGTQKLAVLYLDLDGFGRIQAAVGVEAAAGLLRGLAERLRARIRETDTAARVGDDEFAVLVTHLEDELDAARVVAKIVESFGYPLPVGLRTLTATASIGIATFPSDGAEPEVLVRKAEAAMLRARQQGGSCYEFHASEMNAAMRRVLAIEARMPVALAGAGADRPLPAPVRSAPRSHRGGRGAGALAASRARLPDCRTSSCRWPRSLAGSSRSVPGCFARPASRRRPGTSAGIRGCGSA